MEKQKPIPWIKQLRQKAKQLARVASTLSAERMVAASGDFYQCHRRLVEAADFTGVTWKMTYYSKSHYGVVLHIEAEYGKRPTRWMAALKEAHSLGKRYRLGSIFWKNGTRFSDNFHKAAVTVDSDGIAVEFQDEDRAIVFCRKHKIRDIDLKKIEQKCDESIKTAELERRMSRAFAEKAKGERRGKRHQGHKR